MPTDCLSHRNLQANHSMRRGPRPTCGWSTSSHEGWVATASFFDSVMHRTRPCQLTIPGKRGSNHCHVFERASKICILSYFDRKMTFRKCKVLQFNFIFSFQEGKKNTLTSKLGLGLQPALSALQFFKYRICKMTYIA